jgi:hypothetical protein
MTFLSASEDFQERTLGSFQSALEKLVYLARLRGAAGQYSHWGMSRTYGEAAAAVAIADVHSQVWIEVLRTPISELFRQLEKMGKGARGDLLQELNHRRADCCPNELQGGSIRHFNSILLTLNCLSRSPGATRQVA